MGWNATHHEVDGRPAAEDMSARNHGSTAIEPFRGTRVVEGGSLAVQLHVPGEDTRPVDPIHPSMSYVIPETDSER